MGPHGTLSRVGSSACCPGGAWASQGRCTNPRGPGLSGVESPPGETQSSDRLPPPLCPPRTRWRPQRGSDRARQLVSSSQGGTKKGPLQSCLKAQESSACESEEEGLPCVNWRRAGPALGGPAWELWGGSAGEDAPRLALPARTIWRLGSPALLAGCVAVRMGWRGGHRPPRWPAGRWGLFVLWGPRRKLRATAFLTRVGNAQESCFQAVVFFLLDSSGLGCVFSGRPS